MRNLPRTLSAWRQFVWGSSTWASAHTVGPWGWFDPRGFQVVRSEARRSVPSTHSRAGKPWAQHLSLPKAYHCPPPTRGSSPLQGDGEEDLWSPSPKRSEWILFAGVHTRSSLWSRWTAAPENPSNSSRGAFGFLASAFAHVSWRSYKAKRTSLWSYGLLVLEEARGLVVLELRILSLFNGASSPPPPCSFFWCI